MAKWGLLSGAGVCMRSDPFRLFRIAAGGGLFSAALAAIALGGAPPARAAGATDPAPVLSSEQLTAVARLLAGVDPGAAAGEDLKKVAQTETWRIHRKASQYGDRQLRVRLQHMDQWQRSSLPTARDGATLVYPFSGPDFVNAFALFPDYKTYVFFSLEPPGEVPALARMDDKQLGELFSDLRGALNDLVALNFFITPNMKENIQTSSLQGTVPVMLAMMGLLELRVISVEPFEPWTPGQDAVKRRAGRPALPLRAVRIEFEDRWQTRRSLLYLSLDVSDSQLSYYPEFVPWLRAFESPTVLLKSASYLLHGNNFRKVRGAIRDRAGLIVQDDTGMPYRILRDNGFQIALFGQYEHPVKLFENRYQKDLDSAFESAGNPQPVPFPFGYNWRKEGRSGVIVARRPSAGA
jgi:hypothetical protein